MGLENSRFSDQPVAIATQNYFVKLFDSFFVRFGRRGLYPEMMLQDKLLNRIGQIDGNWLGLRSASRMANA